MRLIASALSLLVFSTFLMAQNIELRFSHKLHVTEQELECTTCHQTVEESTTGRDNLLPTMETCSDCHDVESDDNCQQCHTDVDNAQAVPRIENYSRKNSHKKHLDQGLECLDCHQVMATKEEVEPIVLPNMEQCMTCHQARMVSTECATCHFPDEQLKPASHTLGFLHNHSDLAAEQVQDVSGGKKCSLCHQSTNFCQSCHQGDNLQLQTHPQNFEFTHSLFAQAKERECLTCHEDRSFCRDCHVENHVMPQTHTAGWANRIKGDGGRHRMAAEMDLEYCMTCHEQNADQICGSCHEAKK